MQLTRLSILRRYSCWWLLSKVIIQQARLSSAKDSKLRSKKLSINENHFDFFYFGLHLVILPKTFCYSLKYQPTLFSTIESSV
jgi:hypothetical protein